MLDELSATAPVAETNANVRVRRTIQAGEWSTICLPFAMTEEQCKEAFGDDVQLGDFTAWESEEDDDGNIVAIKVTFGDISSIEANHPVIIKTSVDLAEFTVDGVDIEVEDEPTVQVGKKKAERGYFIGTYMAGTEVPENDLFLSDNKFWYSKGLTKMKAFRGYFEFADVLTEVEEASARINIFFDEPTGVRPVSHTSAEEDCYYNLAGQRVESVRKGLYIKNHQKVFVK